MPHPLRPGLILAAALTAAPALAADEPPAATAPASPSVAAQIEAFLRDSPVAQLPADTEPAGVTSSTAPRLVHGEVAVGVGSHGYRSVYVRTDLPLGETGRLSIAVEDTRGGYRVSPRGGQNLGVGLSLGEPNVRPCHEPRDLDADQAERCASPDGFGRPQDRPPRR
jgi:hypothetical protein